MTEPLEESFSTESYEERLIVFIDLVGFKKFITDNSRDAEIVKEITAEFQSQVSDGFRSIVAHPNGYSESYAPAFTFFRTV